MRIDMAVDGSPSATARVHRWVQEPGLGGVSRGVSKAVSSSNESADVIVASIR